MRGLFFIFVVISICITGVLAQTSAAAGRAFDEGMQEARANEYEKAIEHFRRAKSLLKDGARAGGLPARVHFNLGVCLYHLKRSGEAVGEFAEAVRLSNGSYQKAFYALGMAHTELENWGAAEAAFRRAVDLKRDDAEAWFDLALVLLESRDLEGAKEAFQNAVRYRSAAAADAHNNIGVILALKGDMASAENEFKKALRLSRGKSAEARSNLKFCASLKQSFNRTAAAAAQLSMSRDLRK
jgi:Flp pilus assembly protein TadD